MEALSQTWYIYVLLFFLGENVSLFENFKVVTGEIVSLDKNLRSLMFDVLSILYFICKIYYNSPLNKTDCSKNVAFLPWKNDVKQILKCTSFQVLFMKTRK